MSVNKEVFLLDELQTILQKQIKLAQQGNIGSVKNLAEQAGLLMEKITKSGTLELPEFKNHQEKLRNLYKKLGLSLASQKTKIADELNRIRKGKKTVGIYRDNIQRKEGDFSKRIIKRSG